MTDTRSPEQIERELERDRAGLSGALEDLQSRFSLDGMVRQFSDQLRDHGGEIGTSVSRAARDNPMALALTGVGIAWMIFGGGRNRAGDNGFRDDRSYQSDGYRDDPASRHLPRRQDEYAPSRVSSGGGAFAESGGAPAWMHSVDDHHRYAGDHAATAGAGQMPPAYGTTNERLARQAAGASVGGGDSGASADGGGLGARVSKGAAAMGTAASDAAGSARDAAGAARDGLQDASARVGARASAMRDRLAEGTENLGAEARSRVIAARERAIEAQSTALRQARHGRDRAIDLFEEQPLIAGAIALAVGAAVGAALPRSRVEDEYMGAQSDTLIREAERIFAEEKSKAESVIGAAAQEARTIANEAASAAEDKAAEVKADADRKADGDTAAEDMAGTVSGEVKGAAQRIGDAARREADRTDLGKRDA